MNRVKVFNLMTLVALTLLALVPKMESQDVRSSAVAPITQRPLCASQFALANYACARLPFSPGSPPEPPPDSPPSPDDDGGDGDGDYGHHHHRNRHGHRHGHRHRDHHEPEEEECCRWAKEVDSQCVCELLVRLPPFLMRPAHQYSLVIGEDCHVTYSCGGPI
ncbi:hypothetical protein RIF29_37760 [Crotalaria pallida]|uniref:Bifunctional inhibitor/plant lipid transfer protein/seed storage helical domain-containing protein n=1 Tax=Crotalaria pallida TaxID=3830 RepID=A0AAN9E0Z3_CROPI